MEPITRIEGEAETRRPIWTCVVCQGWAPRQSLGPAGTTVAELLDATRAALDGRPLVVETGDITLLAAVSTSQAGQQLASQARRFHAIRHAVTVPKKR